MAFRWAVNVNSNIVRIPLKMFRGQGARPRPTDCLHFHFTRQNYNTVGSKCLPQLAGPALCQCWAYVCDVDSTLTQSWVNSMDTFRVFTRCSGNQFSLAGGSSDTPGHPELDSALLGTLAVSCDELHPAIPRDRNSCRLYLEDSYKALLYAFCQSLVFTD